MKKILVSGYYGFNNAGDEAVLAALIEALQDEIPDIEITVLSNSPERTEKQYGVTAVDRWSWKDITKAMRSSDLFISGGGSLLQDVTGPKSIIYYLGLIRLAVWMKKPVMFYAQGIGPVQRPWARKLLARAANRVSLITVRDEGSLEDLISMGVKRPPLYVTADPVLGWEKPAGEAADVLCRAKVELGPRVGVSLRSWKGIDPQEMAAFCDWITDQGYQVVLLPFHFPGDIGICREVAKLMKHESFLVKENLTPMEMIDAVGSMHLVIGMRLHALIMAAVKGVPFVAISYDPKIERFSRQVGQTVACTVEGLSAGGLEKKVEQILADYRLIKNDLQEKAAVLKVKARENARLARKLIDN